MTIKRQSTLTKETLYKGSSKVLYQSLTQEHEIILSFSDDFKTAKGKLCTILGKGTINNTISAYLMEKLEMIGIENHLIKKHNMCQQLVRLADVYPLQVHVSTVASKRYNDYFSIESGTVFHSPIIDFRVKQRKLNYPSINESQIINFGWLSEEDLEDVKDQAIRAHDFLCGIFAAIGIRLVDVQLEFGRIFNGEDFVTMLVDEISPDTCILWDMKTNKSLCYETIEENPDEAGQAYNDIFKRLNL